MNRPRLIVFLMMDNRYLRKSKKFNNSVYIGDPLNIVRIFSDYGADEVIFVDVNATKNKQDPDYELLENIASFSRMPICYGGGIRNIEQIEKLINLGIEKVSICSSAFQEQNLIRDASNMFGRQSIVGCLDIKFSSESKKYRIYTNNGTNRVDLELFDAIKILEDKGVGELLINNIDLDGTYKGFDEDIIFKIVQSSSVPVSVAGGAKSINNIKNLWIKTNVSGIAAGSLWSFIGKNDAVLPNYPDKDKKQSFFRVVKKDKNCNN